MESDEIQEKKSRQEYEDKQKYRDNCRETEMENHRAQDKAVMTISSALFGLLLTMYDKLNGQCQVNILLKLLVVTNALTLIMSILAFSVANKATDENLQFYLQRKQNHNGCWEIIADFLNYGYLITTCLSIIILSIIMCMIF